MTAKEEIFIALSSNCKELQNSGTDRNDMCSHLGNESSDRCCHIVYCPIIKRLGERLEIRNNKISNRWDFDETLPSYIQQ